MASFLALLVSLRTSEAWSSAYVQYDTAKRWPEYEVTDHPKWVEEAHDHHIVFEDSQKYNCHIGLATWKTSWSKSKQSWCCMSHPEVCASTHLPFDCDHGLSMWKAWPEAKQKWCCRNFGAACTGEQKYDCDAGVWNWQVGWSANKKAFCCEHFQRGCGSVSTEHLCDGHEEEWDACPNQPRCNACTPVDCLFTAWTKWYEEADCIGLQIRHRSIEVHNNECGLPCFGTKTESKRLEHLHPKCLKLKQDCIFHSWSQWSVCQNQVDQAVRSRHIDKASLNGGVACKGSTKETRPCGGPEAKPCIFSDWHEWTSCSTSCGEGYQSRQRRVASEDYLSGQTCDDALLDTRSCNDAPCSTRDAQISHWSQWSPCSGSLQKTRRREVLASPEGVGMGFNVSLVEAGKCSPPEGEDCIVSEWSGWSTCDKSCHGGQSFRHRRIMRFNMKGGQCPIASLKEVKACNVVPCSGETKNCQWQAWNEWGSCSHQHGAGLSQRKRDFIAATGDGEACSGSTSELKACVVQAEEVIDCAWGQWTSWSECTTSCGGGTKQRSRSVSRAPNAKGKACDPLHKEVVEPCNTQLCGDCQDGLWGEWSAWGSCSAECGQAIQVRNRSVARQANACGKSPVGSTEEFKLCDGLPLCEKDRDCRLTLWSDWSKCNSECHGLRQRVRKVAAMAYGGGKPCDSESLTEVSDCNPIPGEAAPLACGPLKEKKDCVLEQWSLWGPCSVTCGDGQQLRKRSVVEPSANGGKLCAGNLTVVRGCQLPPCPVEVAKDCHWGAWSSWGECTHCSGQRTRHRVIEQLPTMGGRLCDSKEALEMSNCSSTCHETRFCAWSPWSDKDCSSCDTRTSSRHRSLKLTEGFGAADVLFTGTTLSNCIGTQVDEASCSTKCEDACEAQDCTFAAWSDWSKASCSGLCERQRVISELNNKCGSPCSGSLHETKRCDSPCHPPVDCELSEWSAWSACSNATGYVGGQSHRSRSVAKPPQNGGLACYGDLGQTKACRGDLLGSDCELGSWESWSECSTSCGEGFRTRQRGIQRAAEAGGAQCNGMLSEVSGCHAGYWEECGLGTEQHCELAAWEEWSRCSITMTRERVRHFKQQARLGGLPCHSPMHEIQTCHADAVDCVVSDWTDWDECDATCGAAQARRQRQVTTFPNLHGKPCPTDLAQMKACSVPNCDVKDCQVSGWLSWSDCSTSCGQGHQSRQRSVINLREPGGYGCFFSIAERRVCHGSVCSQDCEWHEWEEWQKCSQSCGGLKTRKRKIKAPENGGKHCDEKDMQEVRACNVGTCHGTCINGLWGMWEDWAPCSVSCGGGLTFRTREVKRMANSCGNPAIGDDKETKFCNVDTHCRADKDCLYTGWSTWNACSASCSGIRDRRRNIASYGHGAGLFCQGALQEVEHCETSENCGEGPSVDCEMNTWSEWSSCSASCDGGEMRRSRQITQHRKHGGKTCKGPLEEAKECARDHCGGGQAIDCVYGEWKEWAACLRCSGERKRFRHILVYPAEGGRECAPADLEEIGSCPNPCAEEKYCTWQSWSNWGACSMTCGPGGKRKRSRSMSQATRPATAPKAAKEAKAAKAKAKAALVEKYRALYVRTQHMEDGQLKEILLAFAAGFLALFALGGLARRVRQPEVDLRDTEAQVSDSERPFLANL